MEKPTVIVDGLKRNLDFERLKILKGLYGRKRIGVETQTQAPTTTEADSWQARAETEKGLEVPDEDFHG